MFKKALSLSIIAALFLMLAPLSAFAESVSSVVDKSSLDQGIIKIDYTNTAGTPGIVRIGKGSVTYDYNLVKGAQYPLQLGDGDYSVLIALSVGQNKYKVVSQETVKLKSQNGNAVFLQSNPVVNWNASTKAVIKAKSLVVNASSDQDKIAAIYSFITKNFKYDLNKKQTVEAGYIPNLDKIYASSKGICYDYAAAFAAMARSQGIPTKLAMGYEAHDPHTYHAWNQVFLKDSQKWVTIDTTYDASRVQNGQATPMFKDASDYSVSKIY